MKIVYNFMIIIIACMQLVHLCYLNISIPWRHEHLQDSGIVSQYCVTVCSKWWDIQSTIHSGNAILPDNPCMLTNLATAAHNKKNMNCTISLKFTQTYVNVTNKHPTTVCCMYAEFMGYSVIFFIEWFHTLCHHFDNGAFASRPLLVDCRPHILSCSWHH